MSWREGITKDSATWRSVTEYIAERIVMLTATCVAPDSPEMQIRQAQAAIAELQLLADLPRTLVAESQMRQMQHRKEY